MHQDCSESLLQSYFPRGNAKKTGATSKDYKEYPYCYFIFFKSTAYAYRTTFSTVIRTLLGEGGRGTYWKGGAY